MKPARLKLSEPARASVRCARQILSFVDGISPALRIVMLHTRSRDQRPIKINGDRP